jgi:protein-disulfide isomerase
MISGHAKSSWLTGVLVACALLVTGLTFRRELLSAGRSTSLGSSSTVQVPEAIWRDLTRGGYHFGAIPGRVRIVVLEDFECPACRAFANGPLASIRREFAGRLEVIVRDLPLDYHRFAVPTARAAGCAAAQGRFEQFHDLVFQKQDSLGLKSYAEFANESGVPDLVSFEFCLRSRDSLPDAGWNRATAIQLGATGTPTVIVEGTLFGGVPDSLALHDRISRVLEDHSPTDPATTLDVGVPS